MPGKVIRFCFNGTKGRVEHTMVEAIYVNGTNTVQGGIKEGGVTTPRKSLCAARRALLDPWRGDGEHAGGDKVMLDDIFLPNPAERKYLEQRMNAQALSLVASQPIAGSRRSSSQDRRSRHGSQSTRIRANAKHDHAASDDQRGYRWFPGISEIRALPPS